MIVPRGHALTRVDQLTLEKLATYPLITYSPQFTGRSHIDEAFAAKGLKMDVVLTAIDADVIKTYTELGLGVGIVAAMAYDAEARRQSARQSTPGICSGPTPRASRSSAPPTCAATPTRSSTPLLRTSPSKSWSARGRTDGERRAALTERAPGILPARITI